MSLLLVYPLRPIRAAERLIGQSCHLLGAAARALPLYLSFLFLGTDDLPATLKALEISEYESSMMPKGMKTQMAAN